MTHPYEGDPKAPGGLSGDDGETADRSGSSDCGSLPAEGSRTGEEQAAINQENDPPA
jgi:hypothetical protein